MKTSKVKAESQGPKAETKTKSEGQIVLDRTLRAGLRISAFSLRTSRRILLLALAVASLPTLSACGKKAAGGPAAGGGAIQVVAVEAKRQPVVESLSLVGTLLPNESVEIKPEIEGTVQEVKFEDGRVMKAGDLLIVLDESKLAASLARAEANFKLSQANFARSQQLLEGKFISPQEFDQAASSLHVNEAEVALRRRELKDARIVAPFAGTMGPRLVSPGQVIARNTVIGKLVSMDPLKVEFSVPERFLGQLRIGQAVELALAAFPGQKFRAEVYFIDPAIDSGMRTALMRARLPNPDGRFKPGMFTNLDLALEVRQNAVVVPEMALISQGDAIFVMVVDENSCAQLRPVRTGVRLNGDVEIADGLRGGERVIVEGHQKTPPGAPVKVATTK